jgi:hypothetical protein
MPRQSDPEPDEIEQQIIATVPSVLQERALWTDNSSFLTRVIGKSKSGLDAAGYASIDEELWTRTFIERLSALGRRLGFTSNDYDRQRGWGYDVLWRDLNTSGVGYQQSTPGPLLRFLGERPHQLPSI